MKKDGKTTSKLIGLITKFLHKTNMTTNETNEPKEGKKSKYATYLANEDMLNIKEAIELASEKLSTDELPQKIETTILPDTAHRIIITLGNNLQTDLTSTVRLIFLLFLRGGRLSANKGAPDSLNSSLINNENKITLTKGQLLNVYKAAAWSYPFQGSTMQLDGRCRPSRQAVTGNSHLRRLAEYLATDISNFAAANNIPGESVNRVSALLNRNEEPLSSEERSWCSSFNQKNPDCINRFPRLSTLIAVDYRIKFSNKKPSDIPGSYTLAKTKAVRKGQGNKKNNIKKKQQ
jgi:hypothetical protein